MSDPTYDELVKKHNELLAFKEAAQAAFDEQMKPYNEGITTILAVLLAELQRQKAKNFKTEHGTAYQRNSMSVKVDNQQAFMEFMAQNKRWDFLSVGVLKDPVRDWLDTNDGTPPPGIKVDFFTKCHIKNKVASENENE